MAGGRRHIQHVGMFHAGRTPLVASASLPLFVLLAGCLGTPGADPSGAGGSAGTGGGAGASGAAGVVGGAGTSGAAGVNGAAGTNTAGTNGAAGTSAGAGTAGGGGIGGRGGGAGTTAAAGRGGGAAGTSAAAGRGGTTGAGGRGGGSAAGTTGAAGGGGGDATYPCDGSTAGYEVIVSLSGSTWTAMRGGTSLYSGSDMRAAVQAGIGGLTAGRTTKQRVLVQGSGSVSAGSRIDVASYTVLNVCGTINVTGSGSGDQAPIYARAKTDIEVPNVKITGAPLYAMFFRDVDNLRLGQIDIRVTNGLGIRIDNHGRSDRSQKVRNIQLDYAYVQGTTAQAVETYGVDGFRVGTVIARSVGESGLLLNDTVNAEVGVVDGADAGAGTGYAAFRMANRNGRINNAYPANIHVGQVIARRGGRGIFCVSESGGAVIDRIDIADTGSNAILLENCYNVNIAAVSGTVSGGGEIRIAARDEFPPSSDITIQNLTVTNNRITENPCAANSTFRNNTLVSSTQTICQ
jgi:hypothetical protein